VALRTLSTPVLLLACTAASAEPTFSGIARAKDGDSLMVGEREVRLFGIDAPEWNQTCTRGGASWACGETSANQLSKLVTGKQVRCTRVDTDEHGRTVARCTAGSVDVNRHMVSNGYATAYRHYSLDYVSAEDSAKAAKRGLWAGTFEMPSDVRRAAEKVRPPGNIRRVTKNPVVQSIASSSSGCTIKGNRGRNGWIYHLPGMPFYGRTKAEEMFCSEVDAQAAGYRRAKVR
jgi:endonuclease YncB( thermonuclease family)